MNAWLATHARTPLVSGPPEKKSGHLRRLGSLERRGSMPCRDHCRLEGCIEAAKAKLTDKQYFALEIALSPSVSLAEAAKRAGLSESTLRQRVLEGRKRMHELLKASKAL